MTNAERMKRLTVALLVEPRNLLPGQARLIPEHTDMFLLRALRNRAGRVVLAPYDGVAGLAKFLEREKPDVIFNLTESVDDDRSQDGHICALLDLYGVPYTGPGPKGMMLCRDKVISKLIAENAGFTVPRYFKVGKGTRSPLPFPLVVKPQYGDASEGISQASLVRSNESLHRRAAMLRGIGIESIIAEEYAGGRELMVTLLGDRITAVRELLIGRTGSRQPMIFSSLLKHNKDYRLRWNVRIRPAVLTSGQRHKLVTISLRTAAALELRDYGRLDLKLTPSGHFVFLEANPNPAVVPPARRSSASWGDMKFDDVVAEITLLAWRRGKRK